MLIRGLPDSSALWRELAGPMADWDLHAQLLAASANATRFLAWAKTKDAAAKPPKNYPEHLGPPGPEPEPLPRVTSAALADFRKRIGGE